MPDVPEVQLDNFLDRYSPEIAAQARGALAKMRARLPGAVEIVYDNYNALVIGFGPTERASDAVFSLALYPKWVTLFFLRGAGLPDPDKLLGGSGRIVRQIRLTSPDDLDQPAVKRLMTEALKRETTPIDRAQPRRLVIKSVSAKQRPRRGSRASRSRPARSPRP
jgi:hypothetical protein